MRFPSFHVLCAVIGCFAFADMGRGADLAVQIRRPTALSLSADEQVLYVANSRSGSVSCLDLNAAAVVNEIDVGQRLADLKLHPDGKRLFLVDEGRHELVVANAEGPSLEVIQRLPVAQYPVSISISASGKLAVVASLWSQRLTFVEIPADPGESLRVSGSLDLPFAVRCQLLVNEDSRLVAADAFAGRLAIVDPQSRELLHVRSFPSHNIRGLAISPNGKTLLAVHQMLNELAHTTNNDVHWGLLMSNDLRWLPLASILSPTADLYRDAHMHPLGHAGNATGDPSGVAVTAEGTVVVSLGGVGEIAIGTENDFSLHRIAVGRRPTAVITSRKNPLAYVANTLDDSVSVIDLSSSEQVAKVSLGPQPELTLVDRGELLFYDASLSHDGWMSCHSCHTDGHANSLLNDNFSDESFGASKRVLSLLGVADTAPFAWNGKVATLQDQIRNSISKTMQSDETPTDRQLAALESFVQSLSLPPPLDIARGMRDEAGLERGKALFTSLRCDRCHTPPAYTSAQTYDVGIHDKQGNREFNPPSLRGVSQRGPYFHDNRAETLEAVFRDVGHQLERELTEGELRDLITFLRSL